MPSVRAAERRLAQLHATSPVEFEGPNRHRLAQTGGNVVFGSAVRSVEIVREGRPQTEQIRVPRLRVEEDPFTRLAGRGQLDPASEEGNRALRAAGERYQALRRRAGLETLQGTDPGRGVVTTTTGGLLGSEARCDAFDAWTRASRSMSPVVRDPVDALLICGTSLATIGAALSGYAERKMHVAIALHLVRLGLAELDRHFAEVDRGGALA